ncbi:hypothetical protein ABIA69_004231 [Lysinibacillus parviboronicapiens]|uniref:Uncharacterized protein n=1 Tax=Lysinibacillus parviboronicapiens TaxID=436516 RepID=A0ABV2PQ09_9BACI
MNEKVMIIKQGLNGEQEPIKRIQLDVGFS